jgi:hypothetical protein
MSLVAIPGKIAVHGQREPASGDAAACLRRDANCERHASKFPAVIDFTSGFVLPLVHHFVKKRVLGFFPAVTADMPPADDYFGRPTLLSFPRVVSEPAFQTA